MGQGAYILGCECPRLTPQEKVFFRRADPLGFILFARNIENPDQLRALTGELRDAVGRDAPILVDQEGGRVQRLRAPHWREWMTPIDHVAKAGPNAARAMWLRARLIAHELRAVGIDVNCAPVADIADAQTHLFLANRCYGTTAETVAAMARATADGLMAGGVLPVMKHIPGHGGGGVDSHMQLPRVTRSLDALRCQDFAPFAALSDLPAAMSAHVVYSAIDDRPATTSGAVIRVIRDDIGFDGLLISDDLSMQALSGTIATRTRDTLAAGCDVALHCNGAMDEMRDVANAARGLDAAATRRVDAALRVRQDIDPIDIVASEVELRALISEGVYV